MKKILSYLLVICTLSAFIPTITLTYAQSDKEYLMFVPTHAVINDDGTVIYFADSGEKKIYSINTDTYEKNSISLDFEPTDMFYSNGELYVCLSVREPGEIWNENEQRGILLIIDGSSFTITKQFDIQIDPLYLVVSNDGTIFISSASSESSKLHSYTRDGMPREMTELSFTRAKIIYNSQLNKMYAVETYQSTSQLVCIDIDSSGAFIELKKDPWQYQGEYWIARDIHIAPDGANLLGGNGLVFTASGSKADDMKFKAALIDNWQNILAHNACTDMAFKTDGTELYIAYNNKLIYAYNYDSFEVKAMYMAQGNPKYIFEKNGKLIVVSSETVGFDFCFIETIDLSMPYLSLQPTVSKTNLEYQDGRARLSVLSNAETVFNGSMMYVADDKGKALYAIDTETLIETKVNFAEKPNCLVYDKGELFVGFGLNGFILVLDAQTLEIKNKIFPGAIFYDLSIGNDDYVYIYDSYCKYVRSFSRLTGYEVSNYYLNNADGKLINYPGHNILCWASDTISAIEYDKGIIQEYFSLYTWNDFSAGNDIMISPDEKNVFSSNGNVFETEFVWNKDMQYKNFFLPFNNLAFDLPNNQIFVADDRVNLYVYDYDSYEEKGYIKTAFQVKEMFVNGSNIQTLSAEESVFYLELLDVSNILPVLPEKITVDTEDKIFFDEIGTIYLNPTLWYTDGNSISIIDTAVYTFSNENVATVSSLGKLERIAKGYTDLTIEAEGITKTVRVYVDLDLTAIMVNGENIGFSTNKTVYHVYLNEGEIPNFTYEVHDDVLVEVIETTCVPGTASILLRDSDGGFIKEYTIHFISKNQDMSMPFIISRRIEECDGFINLDMTVIRNPYYNAPGPKNYYFIIQLFYNDLTPAGLHIFPNAVDVEFVLNNGFLAVVSIINEIGDEDFIGIPAAVPFDILDIFE